VIVQEVDRKQYDFTPIDTSMAVTVQASLQLRGEPLRYTDQEYFLTPLDDTHYDTVLLRTSRQIGKSTWAASRLIIPAIAVPNYYTLYVSPSFKQTKDFSQTRVDPFLQESEFIRNFRVDKSCQGIETKKFTNMSRMQFRYAFYNADRCRGLSAHLLCLDEIQDILWKNIPIIEQVLAHAKPPTLHPEWGHLYKKKLYSGTPKSHQNPIEKLWKDSTQCVWVVRCWGCGTWSEMEERAIGKFGTICTKRTCRKPIDPRTGCWHMLKPDSRILGFHINALMSPRKEWGPHGWVDWQNDILDYQARYNDVEFYNEVLGYPKDDAARALLEGDIRGCCDDRFALVDKPTAATQTTHLFGGVDWGETNSRTILTIGGFFGTQKFAPAFVKVYTQSESSNPQFLIADIIKWLTLFGVVAVACDVGHGWGMNSQLMEQFGIERVFPIRYMPGRSARLVYGKNKHEWQANRSQVLGEMFMDIKRRKFRFPAWKYIEKLSNDLLAVGIQYSGRLNELIYFHEAGTPDDWTHSLCYSRLASELFTGMYTISSGDEGYD
jgi:hypothetical protein